MCRRLYIYVLFCTNFVKVFTLNPIFVCYNFSRKFDVNLIKWDVYMYVYIYIVFGCKFTQYVNFGEFPWVGGIEPKNTSVFFQAQIPSSTSYA